MKLIEQVTDILSHLYNHGWDERNGGNLSYIATEEEVAETNALLAEMNGAPRTVEALVKVTSTGARRSE